MSCKNKSHSLHKEDIIIRKVLYLALKSYDLIIYSARYPANMQITGREPKKANKTRK